MQIASTIQNRQFFRTPVSLEVMGKTMQKFFQGYSFKGESLNISYDGMCFETKLNGLKVGQEIKLETCVCEGDCIFRMKGKICWINSNDNFPRSMNVGVKLIKTRRYDLWRRRVDKMLSLARLSDIEPFSC